MADDIQITAGSGTVVATDEVSSRHYQLVKLVYGADGTATLVSTAAPLPSSDSGASWTQVMGVSGAAFTSADASTAAAVTDAPTSGQKLVIDDVIVSVGSVAMQVDLEIETAGTVYVTIYATANTLYQITPRGKWKLATADKKLMVDTSAAGAISVTAWYHSEA